MHLIIYISEYTGFEKTIAKDLQDICAVAKEKNPEFAITGVLFYHDHHFLQVIEGPQAELESLMTNLASDFRHRDIKRVVDQSIPARSFPEWNMDAFNFDCGLVMDPRTIRRFTEMYSKLFTIHARDYIETLKKICTDPELEPLKVELAQ